MRSPLLSTDFYKTVHHLAYKQNMTILTSYFTPRMSRLEGVDEVIVFGIQAFIIEHLIGKFKDNFFDRNIDDVLKEYEEFIVHTLAADYSDTKHIKQLHELGYLPIEIRALKEGSRAPISTPILSITNTHPGFAWLTNYLETYMSTHIWQAITSATIADCYMKTIDEYYHKTGCKREKRTACGDFSMRGMSSEDSACKSGAGHLTSFTSTACIPAIHWLCDYYFADYRTEVVGKGTASTEHSIMTSYGKEEYECLKHLLVDVFPKNNLSVVLDSYDYFHVLTDILPKLREEILARDGKLFIRGDSGDPVDIICGSEQQSKQEEVSPAEKGTIEILWEIFGGFINEKGYKVLDSHIGAIYGDSITIERCKEICSRLEAKGFSTENMTFGIGSYTYQYNTRDTFGFALKATYAVIDNKEVTIFKEPKTDKDNFKKSQRGLCYVYNKDGKISFKDNLLQQDYFDLCQQESDLLEIVFQNGALINKTSLKEIREEIGRKYEKV